MRTRQAILIPMCLVLFTACESSVVSSGGAGGGGSSSVSSGDGGAPGPTAVSSTSTSTSTGPDPGCNGPPGQDMDGDGWSPAQGDCNDCDPHVNPNAVEAATPPGGTPTDEDCDGQIDNLPQPCDSGLAVDAADPLDGVRAVDLCKLSSGPGDWGVVSASWVLPDGSAPPAGTPEFDLGHGILSGFGPNVAVPHGQSMLGLSSGTARQPTDPGYQDVTGFSKNYACNNPPGFPKESPACPGVSTGQPYDGAALEVSIRVPSNAVGFAFAFNFYTYEWPSFICSTFNDVFTALLSPIPGGLPDGNISFDSQGNPVTVNNVFLESCGCAGGPPCLAGGKNFTCGLGTNGLVGTGFDGFGGMDPHGSTGWLTTSAPAAAGSTITMRWGVHDSGDGVLDTTTLIDHWQWLTEGNPAVLTYRPPMP